ncbi:HWE histidine kinase domain-containing protein [Pseudosulfitobacter pseudonitzschiae]|uniref:HWE histidine kinase domain-containing protein n=1 Tax=Pseudosulfitobacter pseudonitzschiae TaxID=1402135 RepID=UPI001AF624DE|nr:HWE histidine kinase domain-containing protein [Pseudosulfitobacter pseudonitzschiae]MBM1813672.1 PAS domain-containing protein [Pseudosulfitobacter pseudonitzschiae]MBM1830665.1 PAS domain-containing protein [Pseudosulfitobacter pseudonitzschiae]MBM1835532.1 PAS domain-containing protein [Pseudosulfitobacter pseudonitzschiae]MBM1840378.1 PAS domain-containing protein [Pseudosulfitobacter pseudonitzschiae]MBM1845634.1 PAS domain-containing protein [Pseudosulfitobacter pseudonitzschiae]
MTKSSFPASGGDHLDLLLATSEIGIWELDAATGKALRNLRHDQIFGHDQLLDHWSGDVFLTYVVEEDRKRVGALLNASLTDGEPWSFETRIRRADGVDRWISAKGVPKFSETGEVTKLIGHVIDITATKLTEDRLRLLSKELNHRVANTFTIMNSMIRHASKKANTVDQLALTLMERLAALARSNKVLVAEEAERSSLHDILKMELEAFLGWQKRISISGKLHIWFSGEASEALALIFHELLTNAVKHGALSVPSGRVNVTVEECADRRVKINWVETGGPSLVGDRRTGIGSTILQNAMRDEGTVKLDFAAEGLKCDIVINDSFRREAPDIPEPVTPAREDQPIADDGAFSGQRIMVVEDDPIIGLDISDILKSRGAQVIGPCTNVASALKAIRDKPDAVLLDVNLGQETTDVVASQLSDLSIPFLVLSGQFDSSDLGAAFKGVTLMSKPFRERDLVAAVHRLL